MSTDELRELFEKHEDEYLRFARVESKRSKRHDMHAYLLLEELVPEGYEMVGAAEHDEYFLEPGLDEVAAVITEAQIIELIRCGVTISYDSFALNA